MLRLKTKGVVGPLEIVMIVVAIVILGFVGWRVMSGESEELSQEEAENTNIEEDPTDETAIEEDPTDETTDWTAFSPASAFYTIKLMDGWKFYYLVSEDVLFAKCNDATCRTYTPGVPAIVDETTGGRDGVRGLFITVDETPIEATRFTDKGLIPESTFTTASGLEGNKYITVTSESAPEPAFPGDKYPGQIDYGYYFVKSGRGIYISYDVLLGETDESQYVEMAIKTLE